MSLIQVQGKRLVPAEGNLSAKIAIVGEAPGAQEDVLGRPFVGQAGNLLDQCMHSAKIARTECYITNVVKEKPTGNVITSFYAKGGFTLAGMKYLDQLKEELSSSSANVIVAVGNTALAALCGIDSVSKWRGSVLESTLLPGRKVIPILHPASALREYLFKYYITADLRRIRLESYHPEIHRVHRDLKINPTFSDAMDYMAAIIQSKKMPAFDIEIVNQELSCFALAISPTDCMSIPMYKRQVGGVYPQLTESEEIMLWKSLAAILEDEDIPVLGQNINFDLSFMSRKANIVPRGIVHDTMVGHHVVYYDFPKGLDFLCSIYAKEPYYKDEGKIWKNPGMSNEIFWLYNAKDSAITFEAWLAIEKEIRDKGVQATYDFTMTLFYPLLYPQLRGMRADRVELEKTKIKVGEQIDAAQAELNKMCGFDLNVNSPKQCQDYFYIKKGFKPYTNRSTGSITTDDKAMTQLERKGVREAMLVKKIRGLKKLKSTYLDMEFDDDNRLRCSYNSSATTTGRLSSSQTIFGTGANFQNIPPEFKTFLTADEDMLLMEFDKRQAEWIVVAYVSGDANMIEVVEKGLDAHCRTGELMFGAPMSMIKNEDEIIGNTTDEFLIKQLREERIPEILKYNPIINMSLRQAAKKSNHGLNYDLGANGFSMANQIPLADAKRCVVLYHKAYPGIRQWHASIVNQLSLNRTLTTCMGRKRWFGDRWSDELFKAGYAQIPQSTVADNTNLGLIMTYAAMGDVKYMRMVENLAKVMPELIRVWMEATLVDGSKDFKMTDSLGQVHDSYVVQYPYKNIDGMTEACIQIKKFMEPRLVYGGREFVIPTDLKIGYRWGDMQKVKLVEDPVQMKQNLVAAIEKIKR